jgi:predicted nucleic acid-binding protein
LVLEHPAVEEVLATEEALLEVEEYAFRLASKKGLPGAQIDLALRTLRVTPVKRSAYSSYLGEAAKRIGARDPDDVHVLALALAFEIPIWTNDRDFEVSGVICYSTEQMLRLLKII